MSKTMNLLILPGDGIGPEIMSQVREIAKWLETYNGIVLKETEGLIGGASIDAHGTPLSDRSLMSHLDQAGQPQIG